MKINERLTDKNMEEITVEEFSNSGALWFVNTILHAFGLVLGYNKDKTELKVFRTRFRGFSEETNQRGYTRLSSYMKEMGNTLSDEINDKN